MNKVRPVLVVAAILMIWVFASVTVWGGRRVAQQDIEAQLGARFATPLAQDVREGQVIEAIIIDVGKLARFGIVNVKRGDKIRLIKGSGESEFVVEIVQRVSLSVNSKGVLERTGK